MVSSKTTKSISLAISLLVVVISLTGVAQAATAPTVSTLGRYVPGFSGMPGKIVSDAAGNMFATDFWGKGIVKLDRQGSRIGFVPTESRPTALAVRGDGTLVVAMSAPRAFVAFYSQSGDKLSEFSGGPALYRPSGVTIDASGNIYVLDAGDDVIGSANAGKIRVYDAAGSYLNAYGTKTDPRFTPTAGVLEFRVPNGIVYEKTTNKLFVADSGNQRLMVVNPYPTVAFSSSLGTAIANNGQPVVNTTARISDPTDIAFEYFAGAIERIFVTDRSRGDVVVVEPVTGIERLRINAAAASGGKLKLPSGVVYRQTGTVVATGKAKGVLYVTSGSVSTGDNVVAFGLDGGTISNPSFALALTSTVPPTSTTTPLVLSGTISPVYPVNCSINGGTDVLATPSGNDWSVSLGLVNGYNYVVCKATDGTDTAYVDASTFYDVDPGSGPVPDILIPANNVYTKNTTIEVSGTTTQANASLKLTNALTGVTVPAVSGADMKWSATIALAEGANVITAYAWKDGTTVATDQVTVNADITPPNMTGTISFLPNGAVTVNAVQNLDGIVVEKNLASVTVNGEEVIATAALPAADSTYFSIPVTLIRGSNEVTVIATDLAGNSSSVTRTVTLNQQLPGFTVSLPGDNSYRAGAGTVAANGSVDASYSSVNAAGTPVTPVGGNWSTATMAVTGGFQSYEFTATGGGNTVKEKRTINANASYALLAITNPPADFATNSSSVIISGTVAAGSPTPTISLDGNTAEAVSSYDSGTGAFSHTVDLVTEGAHYVKVAANASTTAIRNIIYDSTVPFMAIQADSKSNPTNMTGAIEPSAKLTSVVTTVGGSDVTLPLQSVLSFVDSMVWNVDLTGYTFDAIRFTTVDPAGNLTARTFVNGIPTGDVDMDGAVRLSDALACLRHVAGTELLNGTPTVKDSPRFQADVGSLISNRAAQDGEVTVVDAVLILQKAYGLMTF